MSGFYLGEKGVHSRCISRGGARDYVQPSGRGQESDSRRPLILPYEIAARSLACCVSPPIFWPAIWWGGWL